MARCRVGYLAVLLAAVVFFLAFEEYFSFYILVLTLLFPFFSLAVSLPGMLGCSCELVLPRRQIRRGGEAEALLRVKNRFRLPVGRVSVEQRAENLLTGEKRRVRRRLYGLGGEASVAGELPTGHCGVVRWEAASFRVCDLLGLFALRRPLPPAGELTVLPADLPARPIPALAGGARQELWRPRPGGGPGEDYDLRPYRPGDPLRSVHWKLSSKVDGLVVRETLECVRPDIILTYDHFGPPEALDGVFDALDAACRALIEGERPHSVAWRDPESGEPHRRFIYSLNDLRAWEGEAFSTPAPRKGLPVEEGAFRAERGGTAPWVFHVAPGGEEVARLG